MSLLVGRMLLIYFARHTIQFFNNSFSRPERIWCDILCAIEFGLKGLVVDSLLGSSRNLHLQHKYGMKNEISSSNTYV